MTSWSDSSRATGALAREEAIDGLEVIPRKVITYRDCQFEEMDTDAILARHPQRALVDELAHTNVPGSRHVKRWQDVDELLDAGIDVITTVNIQHLESLNDIVERITGVRQRETVPDDIVRAADQIEVVDITPEALRRRMVHGNIYGPDKVDAALANYFQIGNLAALRELALLWVANEVDAALEEYRARHGITDPWETRERIVVGLTESPHNEDLIRRSARRRAATPRRAPWRPRRPRRGARRQAGRSPRAAPSAPRGSGRRVPRCCRRRRRVGARRLRPRAERHPARDRLESTLTVDGVGARIGHQPRDSASRTDQRPGDVPRSRREAARTGSAIDKRLAD